MKNTGFRSVDFWKTSIMILPDNAFFELLRTIFGKIKTPFNKQVLMGDLEKFLSQSAIKKNIAAYIDNNDIRIMTAVAILHEPVQQDLEHFFAEEWSFAELHDMLINLEERFILYRFIEKGKSHLALNPVLKSIISPLVADRSLLFPSFAAGSEAAVVCTYQFDDRILAALFSFVAHNEDFYKQGGGIRLKVSNAAKTIFPGLPLETIIGSLSILGLFNAGEDKLSPDYPRFEAFGRLSRRERMEYCAAGIYCYELADRDSPPWLLRGKIRSCATFMHHFLDSLDEQCLYPLSTLHKLLCMHKTDGMDFYDDRLLDALQQTGLLLQYAPSFEGTSSREGAYWQKASSPDAQAEGAGASVAMDSPYTALLYPEIAYDDALALAVISRVIEAGLNVRFELNRDSAVTAFDRGIAAEFCIELLQRLSQNRIDENVLFSLRDWEKSYQEVRLHKGLVITLSPERRYLAETKALCSLITETLAPGVYLVPETAEEKVSRALKKAGVAIIARRDNKQGERNVLSPSCHSAYPNLDGSLSATIRPAQSEGPAAPGAPNEDAALKLKQGFHGMLGKRSLGAEERDELSARIDRRLMLCESQLKDALVRYEKLEARGLDYAGKALIAKQAIAMQSLVEAVLPGKHIFGIPQALEKAGGESILVIEPINDKGDEVSIRIPQDTIRIPLGKISLLRRIKKSIFDLTT